MITNPACARYRRTTKISMLPFVIASMLSTTPEENVMLRAQNLANSVIGNDPVGPVKTTIS